MKYALFTVSMPNSTPQAAIEKLSELGYDGVEWRVTKDDGDTSLPGFWKGNRCTLQADWPDSKFEEIAKMCRDAGLVCPNLGTYVKHNDLDLIERLMAVANIFDAPCMRIGPGGYNGTVPYEQVYYETLASLSKAIALGKKYDVKILLEMHPGHIMPSASAARRVVSHFNHKFIGVMYDVGNIVREGFESYQLGMDLLGEYLAYVHVKSAGHERVELEGPQKHCWKGVNVGLREGAVDFGKFYGALRAVGYDGWLSVEDFSTDKPEDERIEDNLLFLKEMETHGD